MVLSVTLWHVQEEKNVFERLGLLSKKFQILTLLDEILESS